MKSVDKYVFVMRWMLELFMVSVVIVVTAMVPEDQWIIEALMIVVIVVSTVLLALYEQSVLVKHLERPKTTITPEEFELAKAMLIAEGNDISDTFEKYPKLLDDIATSWSKTDNEAGIDDANWTEADRANSLVRVDIEDGIGDDIDIGINDNIRKSYTIQKLINMRAVDNAIKEGLSKAKEERSE